MTDLRQLLELLYLARTRWRTARFAMDDWTDLEPPLIGAVEQLIDFVTDPG